MADRGEGHLSELWWCSVIQNDKPHVEKAKPRLYLTPQQVWCLHWCPSPAPSGPAPPGCADCVLPRLVLLRVQGLSCWRCVHLHQEALRQPVEPQLRIQLSVYFLNRCQGPNYFIFPSPKPISSRRLYLSQVEDPVARRSAQSHVVTPVQVVLVHTLTYGRQTPQFGPPLLIPPKNQTSQDIQDRDAWFNHAWFVYKRWYRLYILLC